MRVTPGHGKSLSYYDFGDTTVYAAAVDPRCAWCAYIPESYEEDGSEIYPVAVIVHGTERGMQSYRDQFRAWAEAEQVIAVFPLFPVNLCFPGDLSSYKILRQGDVHYDRILLGILDEVQTKWRICDERVLMYGFSGGGHFTHRFLFLHPERIRGAAIGAPGIVTLLDDRYDFWVGTRNYEALFGRAVDPAMVAKVPVQLIAGAADLETWEIAIPEGSAWWMPGAELAGATRVERITSLTESLRAKGVAAELELVPGISHDDRTMLPKVQDFFSRVLRGT